MEIPRYIYLSYSDLCEETREEIEEMAYEELEKEYEEKEAENLNMKKEDLLRERVDDKLREWSLQGKFIFNI